MTDRRTRKLDLLFATMVETTGHVVGEGLPDAVVRRVLGCALEIFDARGAFLISSWEGQELVKYSARRGALRGQGVLVEKRILRELGGLAKRAHDGRDPVVVPELGEDLEACEECDLIPGVRADSLLVVAMREGRESVGVLGLLGKQDALGGEEERRLAQVLADHTGVALRAAEKHRAVERLGFTDALTGAYNYRFLLEAITREIERASRFEEHFSIIMMDMDNLKAYNDVHGHLGGSRVLRRVAQLARRQVRSVDVLAKYGGDEFMVVLPQTSREGANLVAERIRRAIEEHVFPGEEATGRITSSLGIAVYPEDGETVEELINRADEALYRAKGLGRNQVAAGVEEESPWRRGVRTAPAVAGAGSRHGSSARARQQGEG